MHIFIMHLKQQKNDVKNFNSYISCAIFNLMYGTGDHFGAILIVAIWSHGMNATWLGHVDRLMT